MTLCRRCEHRAVGHATGEGPRYECTDFGTSKFSCYMYQPVKPVILKKQKGDERPQFGAWFTTSRSEYNGVCEDLELSVVDYKKKGKALLWVRKKLG